MKALKLAIGIILTDILKDVSMVCGYAVGTIKRMRGKKW